MKPSKELRIKYKTDYNDRTDFASNTRLLQSIWRTKKGFEYEKYGNFLKLYFAKETGANYLTKGIFEIVKHEVENAKNQGKVISEPRIWNNLLSSQPLAFNLFGELKLNLELATLVFNTLYPDRKVKNVKAIEFEYSPGRKNLKYTGDSSAFDVFVVYENELSENCFFGIEVKYAEDLYDEPSTHKETYEDISIKTGIFNMAMLDTLKEKPIQQIWRDHLLVLSMFIKNNDYKVGDFIYLYPTDNLNCKSGIEQYELTFNNSKENYFKPLTLQKLVETIKSFSSENWIEEFENRYLRFEKITTAVNLKEF
jgi:hypothetical protein